jgi:putative ABC transport system ATP-binding protein
VAIARALVIQPKVVLADEPTGNLDSTTGGAIIELIKLLSKQQTITVILVTHNQQAASHADHTLQLNDGRIVD